MSDFNFNELMKMVSKMDKNELQAKMNEVSQMLNSNKSPEEIIKQMNNNSKK